MTELRSSTTDAYGLRIGRELHALSDKAIQPYDPEKIAHAVAVAGPAPRGRWIELNLGWLRGTRVLILAIVILTLALLLATAVGAFRPAPQITFNAGSIAFSRDGDLYVAASDGSDTRKVADGQPSTNEITNLAFSPDRRYLAFVRTSDPVTGAQTLAIASQDGTVKDLYTVPGNPDRAATDADLLFGWAPDSALLAVYPGATATEISIIDTDGKPVRALNLPSGTMVSMKYWSWYGSLAWSPDSNWLVAAVTGGSMSGCIPGAGGDEPCYILLATNGSGAKGTSTAISAYFAWASDSRFAITHWYSKTVEIGRPGGSTPVVISLPGTTIRPDPLVAVNDGHVLAWSPDGTLLLVGGFDKNTYRDTLVVIAPDGTARTVPLDDPFTGLPDPETNFGTEIDDVAWTDDGQRLLFQSARTGSATRGIWSVDVSGGPATLLAETTGPIFDIADGRPW